MHEAKIASYKSEIKTKDGISLRIAYLYTLYEIDQQGDLKFRSFLIEQYDEYGAKIYQPYEDTLQYFKPIEESLFRSKINVKSIISSFIQEYIVEEILSF
jgi:hypothetical protein